ncbi:MAG: hypothetical protein NTW86_06025 [Candidatus Sumerlaeota bacterium]|nr:hypothetical protein [Candidatus Sumerlaeota bacterium]
MATLTDIQDVRAILDRLNAERPSGPGAKEGQTQYQDRGGDFLRRLTLEVETRRGKARVLVSGQIGVGKSSELWRFVHEQRDKLRSYGDCIHCDLEKEEHPERCGATGVLLTILRDCWGATRTLRDEIVRNPAMERRYLRLRDDILNALIDKLKGHRSENGQEVTFDFSGMDFTIYLTEKNQALAVLLGKATQHEAVSNPEKRFVLAPDTLVILLNNLLRLISDSRRGSPPLLIIDHVDKIRDERAAREVLVEIAPQWQRLEASVVMTAPFEFTLGDMRHSVESYWGKPLIVYPVEIPPLEGRRVPEIYNRIAASCGLGKLIEPESLVLLAHYSGGILRSFVQFLIESVKRAHLAGHRRIEQQDARGVIHEAQRAYHDYGLEQLHLLDEIAHEGVGLGAAMTLLRSPIGLLIMEPAEGEQRFCPHPLAERVLDHYRVRHGKAA